MAQEPRSNRSFGLIAAIYLFKCVQERKKKKLGSFNDPRLSGGMLMRRGRQAFPEQPSDTSRGQSQGGPRSPRGRVYT